MNVMETSISGVIKIQPTVHLDHGDIFLNLLKVLIFKL